MGRLIHQESTFHITCVAKEDLVSRAERDETAMHVAGFSEHRDTRHQLPPTAMRRQRQWPLLRHVGGVAKHRHGVWVSEANGAVRFFPGQARWAGVLFLVLFSCGGCLFSCGGFIEWVPAFSWVWFWLCDGFLLMAHGIVFVVEDSSDCGGSVPLLG